ncbi:MAG TPA: carbamoyltransferase C-terminal domain-containing protein, partial [Gemmataceae bacterium]|nr:carbamoyltransferase C-terminal domain-containing protein [Gemmataceae bacterium]
PAAGDAGGALGAALFVWYQLMQMTRSPNGKDGQKGSFLGPRFATRDIGHFLNHSRIPYRRLADERALLESIVRFLAEEKIVGWFSGRMEFGPRALGSRSILGDPRSPKMQATLNLKIKFRESFRPFAPVVLLEHAHEWFEVKPGRDSPYMLLVANVRKEKHVPISMGDREIMKSDPDLRQRVNITRSQVPAVTHVDYSARLQTVDELRNPRFYRLLQEFYRQTGCPILVNTSFNVRGEPIVCTPQEAYRCFQATDMDVLVLEDFVLEKQIQKREVESEAREKYLAQFQLD